MMRKLIAKVIGFGAFIGTVFGVMFGLLLLDFVGISGPTGAGAGVIATVLAGVVLVFSLGIGRAAHDRYLSGRSANYQAWPKTPREIWQKFDAFMKR